METPEGVSTYGKLLMALVKREALRSHKRLPPTRTFEGESTNSSVRSALPLCRYNGHAVLSRRLLRRMRDR